MIRAACLLVPLALLLVQGAHAQQRRDNVPAAHRGDASITGVVLSDEEDPRPLRRARVMISGSELDAARAAITTDDGLFRFDGLPAGRYSLTAMKEGRPPLAFGASEPRRPGRAITLGNGEVRHVTLRLPPGAVITGMLSDPQGDPAPGQRVVILSRRFSPATGDQRLLPVPDINQVTDDRGIYRIFGLPAGSYLVAALPRLSEGSAGDVTVVSREEVQRALADVAERRVSTRPGMPAPARPSSAPPPKRASVAFAPTYYPGTIVESRATFIDLAAGAVRSGVDFDLDYVPLATISGFLTVPPGLRATLTLNVAAPATPHEMRGIASPDADGRFTFRRVQPGHYVIHARAFPPAVRRGDPPGETGFWAATEVIVSGEDLDGVALALEPTLTLSGEVTFDSTTAAAPVFQHLRFPLQIASRGATPAPLPNVVIDGSTVSLSGVLPGPYRMSVPPRGIRSRIGRWWLKSIRIDGQEVLDAPLVLSRHSKRLDITFSDRASELSGTIADGAGAPVTDAFAIVFADDPSTWFLHSRRVAAARLTAAGRYVVSNLPAGNYLIAVSADLDNNEWFDPERLQALRVGATGVTIAEDQVKRQNLVVR